MFYFSSRGSSATVWLAKMLSHHPQVVCFSATRSFPPVDPHEAYPNDIKGTVPEISADMFMEGLLECSKSILNEKVFGSVHGYHGVVAKEPCEKRGGIFSYITRHPVSRIHSVFIYYLYHNYYFSRVLLISISRHCKIHRKKGRKFYDNFGGIW